MVLLSWSPPMVHSCRHLILQPSRRELFMVVFTSNSDIFCGCRWFCVFEMLPRVAVRFSVLHTVMNAIPLLFFCPLFDSPEAPTPVQQPKKLDLGMEAWMQPLLSHLDKCFSVELYGSQQKVWNNINKARNLCLYFIQWGFSSQMKNNHRKNPQNQRKRYVWNYDRKCAFCFLAHHLLLYFFKSRMLSKLRCFISISVHWFGEDGQAVCTHWPPSPFSSEIHFCGQTHFPTRCQNIVNRPHVLARARNRICSGLLTQPTLPSFVWGWYAVLWW